MATGSPRIDAHAHVFHRGLRPIDRARYRPDYDATWDMYRTILDAFEVGRAVLVQPSFLGTDNGYLLDALAQARGRLAGVVVIDDTIADDALLRMDDLGVRGVRFNLIGESPDMLTLDACQQLIRRVDRLGWHIELHADAAVISLALRAFGAFSGMIVVDHFGRPARQSDDEARDWARDPRILVKLSAPYRLAEPDPVRWSGERVNLFGPDRLVWGSDWPWTQHEASARYGALLPERFGLDAAAIARLDRTAERLYFAASRRQEKSPLAGG